MLIIAYKNRFKKDKQLTDISFKNKNLLKWRLQKNL